MGRTKLLLGIAALTLVGCGPGRVGGQTGGVETTGADATDGSTSVGSESAESTETGDPTTSTTSTTTTGPTFTRPEDDIPPFDCDPYMQDCPEGEKCVPYSSTGGNWDDNKCVPVLGNQAPGEACHYYSDTFDATDDCDETSTCWDVMDVGGEPIGTCLAICMGSEDDPECPPNSSCLVASDSLAICIPGCDPLLQDCGDGSACYWANNTFNCIFTTQNIPVGDPCGFINDCAAGLICLAAETLPSCADASCCSAFCDVQSGDAPCDAQFPGTACVPFFEQDQAPPGFEQVGVCILPA